MIYFFALLLSAAAVVLDQISKFYTTANIAYGECVPFLPGVVHFTCLQNDGMSFSLLKGGRWFFVAVTVAVFIIAVIFVIRTRMRHPLGLLSLAAVLGGAAGNLIDRIRFGYVVDMIEVEFVRFAVFNVADIFVVCGGILLVIYAVFFWKDPDPQKGADSHAADR